MADPEGVVGVLHGDPDTADGYREWLADQYDVWTASPPTGTVDADGTDVLVFDWSLPASDRRALVEAVDGADAPAVLAVIEGLPDEDPATRGADDFLVSPGRSALTAAVRTLCLRREYRQTVRELTERAAASNPEPDSPDADLPGAGFGSTSPEVEALADRADRLLDELLDEATYSHLFDRLFRE